MKKNLIIKIAAIALLIILVISIILNKSGEHVDELKASLDNAKIIKVYNYKTKEIINTYNETDTKEIIKKLDYNKWKENNGLNGDEKKYLLKLYSSEDSESIAEIIIHESNEYVTAYVPTKTESKAYKTNHSLKSLFELKAKE